jgi:hypothetical protein
MLMMTPVATIRAQGNLPLKLVQKITIPDTQGRFDHIDVDVDGKRLFVVTADKGSMEVLDLAAGKWVRSIAGYKAPTDVIYVRELNKVFVAIRNEGLVKVYRGDTLDLIDTLKLELGANRMGYDPANQYLLVGNGGKLAGFDYARIAIIDARSDKVLRDMIVNDTIVTSQFTMETSTRRIFATVPDHQRIDVYDSREGRLLLTWRTTGPVGDFALDEVRHRLFAAVREAPFKMIVYDTESGQEVANLPAQGRMNGTYYDARLRRIYVSCGRDLPEGFVYVYQQKNADEYVSLPKVPSGPGAGTSYWVPVLNRLYVAVPAHDKEEAVMLVFEPQS